MVTPQNNGDRKQGPAELMSGEVVPLVSVIVPTFNRAWALRATIDSVFRQSYGPIECLIVDDGSTDGTSAVVKQLSDEAPAGIHLRYFHQENAGAGSARNLGLRECRGDYICYLDSDDRLMPHSIGERARVLTENPEVDICYGWGSITDESGQKDVRMNRPWPREGDAVIAPYLFHTNAPMIRRQLYDLAGQWRTEDPYGLEYEHFARLKYFAREVRFIDKVLSVYVRHTNGLLFDTASPALARELFRTMLVVKALVLHGAYDSKPERYELSSQFRSVAKQLYGVRDYGTACAALHEALMLRFTSRMLAQWSVLKVLHGRARLAGVLCKTPSQYP